MQYSIEYGNNFLDFEMSCPITVKGMQNAPPPIPIPQSIQEALEYPIECESLLEIAKIKIARNSESNAVIVVSVNTRPVPYYGEQGIIYQVVKVLGQAGYSFGQITILIGAGSHRNMEAQEIEDMIGLRAMGLSDIRVITHEYDQTDMLVSL